MSTTSRTHCVVCWKCQYVSDPTSPLRAENLASSLNCGDHDCEVLTVAAGHVALMLWDDDERGYDDLIGEGPF